MLKELVKMAGKLDSLGLTAEADAVDALIKRIASDDLGSEEISGEKIRDREFEDVIGAKTKSIIDMRERHYKNMASNSDMYGLYSSDETWAYRFAMTAYELLDAYKKGEVSEKPLDQLADAIKTVVYGPADRTKGTSEEVIREYLERYGSKMMSQYEREQLKGLNWE